MAGHAGVLAGCRRKSERENYIAEEGGEQSKLAGTASSGPTPSWWADPLPPLLSPLCAVYGERPLAPAQPPRHWQYQWAW